MTTFVVIIEFEDRITREVRGPYRSFKRADGDAKAWHGIKGQTASVEPVLPIDDRALKTAVYINALTRRTAAPTDEQLLAALGPCGK